MAEHRLSRADSGRGNLAAGPAAAEAVGRVFIYGPAAVGSQPTPGLPALRAACAAPHLGAVRQPP